LLCSSGSIGMPRDCKEAWEEDIKEKKTFAILKGEKE
jgi:hypothetical protein